MATDELGAASATSSAIGAEPRDDARFGERYNASGAAALLAVEHEALGSDYQANGYTTMPQADELGRRLDLASGRLLVDIGAGCGWPGLYLAKTTGCDLISLDPVEEGVDLARTRASRDGLADRCRQIRASAQQLPLRSRTVDAVVHTDVLC